MTDLEEIIIAYLNDREDYSSPAAIAKSLGLKSKREINPFLYRLMAKHKVDRRCSSNGSNPTWGIKRK